MSRVFFGAVGLALFVIPALSSCGEEPVAETPDVIRPVKAIKVGDASVIQGRWFAGRASAAREVELAFRVAGPLIELPVNVGDRIDEGGVLARIDPATFKAEVDRIAANVNRAEASLTNAELQLSRQRTLFEQGHVAEAALDKYIATEGEFSAEVRAQKANLAKAELDLGYTVLKAPFSGVVVATYAENFEEVRAKQRVVRLLDPRQIELVVNIPETLISLAPQVTEAIVVFDAFPDIEISATVKEIGTEASQTTRTYPITLAMNQPEGIEILPGMAGKATGKSVASGSGQERQVEVPISATFAGAEGRSMVWVIDEASNKVASRSVETGELTNQGIEITSGLETGEWVVTAGVNTLKEGQQIRILEH